MSENGTRFVCHWHTAIGPGSTYYEGRETVWAEDEDSAIEACQFNVQRRAFRDYSPNHIVVTHVEES